MSLSLTAPFHPHARWWLPLELVRRLVFILSVIFCPSYVVSSQKNTATRTTVLAFPFSLHLLVSATAGGWCSPDAGLVCQAIQRLEGQCHRVFLPLCPGGSSLSGQHQPPGDGGQDSHGAHEEEGLPLANLLSTSSGRWSYSSGLHRLENRVRCPISSPQPHLETSK